MMIKYVTKSDEAIWYSFDKWLPKSEFLLKVAEKRGYVIYSDGSQIGVMRYNMFCDAIPFLTLIYIDDAHQKKGFGTQAILFWENEMRSLGFNLVMTSTQVNESAQHFYRKLGYKDKGSVVFDIPPFEQPLEMFMMKDLIQGRNSKQHK